jgi:multidrug resistance efflux pump
MKRTLFDHGLKARHPLSCWPTVLAFTALSLAGVGCALQPSPHTQADPDGREEGSRVARPVLVVLGVADVEGGVLSLSPIRPGRVVEVPVAENEMVRTGAVLLRLDDEAARRQVEEAEAALEAAEAQLTQAGQAPRQHQLLLAQQDAAVAAARHELAAARLIAAPKEEMAKMKQLPLAEAEAAVEQVKRLEAAVDAEQAKRDALALRDPTQDVKRAEADVRAKRALLDQARHALQEHTLRAPSDGLVLRVLTSPGEALGPQPRQPALLLAPDKPRIVRAEVEQEFVGRVVVGQRAEAEDDAGGAGPPWRGRVVRVAEWFGQRRTILPDTPVFQDVRTLECIVHLDSGQPPLRIGQRVRVRLFNEE